jgi:hypothetical protein
LKSTSMDELGSICALKPIVFTHWSWVCQHWAHKTISGYFFLRILPLISMK